MDNTKRDPKVVPDEKARGLRHLSFCCELYEYQASKGKSFLHEHPSQATSRHTAFVKPIMNFEGDDRTVGHQCQYGAKYDGEPIKKPTGFMSDCEGIRRALSKTCSGRKGQCSRPGGGGHVLCNGRAARMAAIFPLKLCRAIHGGLRDQLCKDGVFLNGHVGMQGQDGDAKMILTHDDDNCG